MRHVRMIIAAKGTLWVPFRKSPPMLQKLFCILSILSLGFFTYIFPAMAASSWNPTVLVNTSSTQVIDDMSSSDLSLQFGVTLNKSLTYDRTASRFTFDAPLYVNGSLGVTGTMSGNALYVQRAFSGAGLTSCINETNDKLLWNSATQQFSCGADQGGAGGLTQNQADARYIEQRGDTMTGGLLIKNGNPTATIDAGLLLEVAGTASGNIIHAQSEVHSSGSLVVEGASAFEGNLTFGDTLADAITVNAASWTFVNDTNFVLSGGVNGLSFDTSTLSIDASNNRVGIGTTAPNTALDVVGTASGTNVYAAKSITGAYLHASSTFGGAGLTNCTGTTNKLTWLSSSKQFSCETDETGGGGAPDTGIFIDTGPAAFADNTTTELFNDATKPNIVTDSTSATVLVSVHMHGIASDTTADAFLAARIVFTTDGTNPSCSTSTQLGEPMIGGFTTNTTHPWQVSGTFLHNPGVAGTIKYTVCTSSVAVGTVTDTAEDVRVSLVELGV